VQCCTAVLCVAVKDKRREKSGGDRNRKKWERKKRIKKKREERKEKREEKREREARKE
jgi:hypothetical protein